MQCLSNKFCGCCNTEVDEGENELTNNDSIKTNSVIKKVDYVSSFSISATNKQINKGIKNSKANEKQKNNNNINNDDDKIFGNNFTDYSYFLENNEFGENDDYSKKIMNNNIYSSPGQSNNSNNNDFGAPMAASETNSINQANNIYKNVDESFIKTNYLNDTYSMRNQVPIDPHTYSVDTFKSINKEVSGQLSLFSSCNTQNSIQ